MPSEQARYWMLSIPERDFDPNTYQERLPQGIAYLRGQKEEGEETGYVHWQIMVAFSRKVTLSRVKSVFGRTTHGEPTRSQAAREYVWKEDTRIAGTQFEFGQFAHRRNCRTDWQAVWDSASNGRLLEIEPSIRVQHYSALRRIVSDYARSRMVERTVFCFIGPTGTGKSHRAWSEAGLEAYPKGPTTKFWDGYNGQSHVVIDEFRGGIDISHVLRWFDKYPVLVEIKGSSTPLVAEKIWITSNIEPEQWYPTLDDETMAALKRRLVITRF